MGRSIESRAVSGAGSGRERSRLLRELLARATPPEQDFLARLLFGELRQGALEGVLLDAVARAAEVRAAAVRRAAMMAGDLAPVARAALADGETALARLRRSASPAGPADARGVGVPIVDEALGEAGRRRARIQARRRPHSGPQGRRRGAGVLANAQRRHRRRAGGGRRRARAAGARADPRRRSHRAAPDGRAASVPGHDAPVRPAARRRAAARGAAADAVLLRLPATWTERRFSIEPLERRVATLAESIAAAARRATPRPAGSGRGGCVSRRDARAAA